MILSATLSSAVTLFRSSELAGEPVIFPTDTIYGIGAPISSLEANKRIFRIKKRPHGQPLPVLVANYDQLETLVERPSEDVAKWLDSTWPGEYTVIFKAKENVAPLYKSENTIAVRMVPEGWLADAIVLVGPVTATSVNRSGEPPLLSPEEIEREFGTMCRFMLWGESGCKPSKIVDVTDGAVKTVRE